MTQKQIASVFVGVVVVILLGVFVYKQYSPNTQQQSQADTAKYGNKMTQSDAKKLEAVPESIDGITESIFVEASADTSALDAEAEGEAAELDEDNQSVNNLENSYDENNL